VKLFVRLRPRPAFSIPLQCNRDLEVWSLLLLNIRCVRFAVWVEPICRRLSSAHQTITHLEQLRTCFSARYDLGVELILALLPTCSSEQLVDDSARPVGQLARSSAVLSCPNRNHRPGEQRPAWLSYAVNFSDITFIPRISLQYMFL
jgi:hypothetical protein